MPSVATISALPHVQALTAVTDHPILQQLTDATPDQVDAIVAEVVDPSALLHALALAVSYLLKAKT